MNTGFPFTQNGEIKFIHLERRGKDENEAERLHMYTAQFDWNSKMSSADSHHILHISEIFQMIDSLMYPSIERIYLCIVCSGVYLI
jgi:hypothetical protein